MIIFSERAEHTIIARRFEADPRIHLAQLFLGYPTAIGPGAPKSGLKPPNIVITKPEEISRTVPRYVSLRARPESFAAPTNYAQNFSSVEARRGVVMSVSGALGNKDAQLGVSAEVCLESKVSLH